MLECVGGRVSGSGGLAVANSQREGGRGDEVGIESLRRRAAPHRLHEKQGLKFRRRRARDAERPRFAARQCAKTGSVV